MLRIANTKINNNIDYYLDFIEENPEYWQLTKNRVISYWNEYHRHKYPKLEEYFGVKLMNRLDKLHTYKVLIRKLKRTGIFFTNGLSDTEIDAIEQIFNIKFPPDLRCFYQIALPIDDPNIDREIIKFPNWRDALTSPATKAKIDWRLEWPWKGIKFDIEENNFWYKSWGEKPKGQEEQLQIAKKHFSKYPKLIPIYSHRYIPETPFKAGNPIYSVYQTDIIYYGDNLEDYFYWEFLFQDESKYKNHYKDPRYKAFLKRPKRSIRFWTDIIENPDTYFDCCTKRD